MYEENFSCNYRTYCSQLARPDIFPDFMAAKCCEAMFAFSTIELNLPLLVFKFLVKIR